MAHDRRQERHGIREDPPNHDIDHRHRESQIHDECFPCPPAQVYHVRDIVEIVAHFALLGGSPPGSGRTRKVSLDPPSLPVLASPPTLRFHWGRFLSLAGPPGWLLPPVISLGWRLFWTGTYPSDPLPGAEREDHKPHGFSFPWQGGGGGEASLLEARAKG